MRFEGFSSTNRFRTRRRERAFASLPADQREKFAPAKSARMRVSVMIAQRRSAKEVLKKRNGEVIAAMPVTSEVAIVAQAVFGVEEYKRAKVRNERFAGS